MHLMLPLTATDIIMLGLFKGNGLLGDLAGEPRKYVPTAEEVREAESHMSSVFRGR